MAEVLRLKAPRGRCGVDTPSPFTTLGSDCWARNVPGRDPAQPPICTEGSLQYLTRMPPRPSKAHSLASHTKLHMPDRQRKTPGTTKGRGWEGLPTHPSTGRATQGSTAVGVDALLTTLLSGQHLLQKTHTVARWLPYAGHLLCARHCYFLSHTAPGHAATKHQGAQMNGKRDGRKQDLNLSLSDSKPRAFNHQNLHTLIKTFHKG